MAIQVLTDFRYRFRSGGHFDGSASGFLFLGTKPDKERQQQPPLRLPSHSRFMDELIRRNNGLCLWFVESATPTAIQALQQRLPECQVLGHSIGGYFECYSAFISAFWSTQAELDASEPWNYEQPWVLAGVSSRLPDPPATGVVRKTASWTIDHVLEHQTSMIALFVQEGWQAYCGVRSNQANRALVAAEFPEVAGSIDVET
jgi:hypothetical protein